MQAGESKWIEKEICKNQRKKGVSVLSVIVDFEQMKLLDIERIIYNDKKVNIPRRQ